MMRWSQIFYKFFNLNAYETIAWFLKDFVLRYKYYLVTIVTFGFSAASIQGGVLFLSNALVTNSQVATNLHNFFLKFDVQVSLEIFLLSIMFIGLGLSAFFVFMQSKLTLILWRRYQIKLTSNLLDSLHNAVKRGLSADYALVQRSSIPLVLKSTQRMGAFTRLVINSILPFMRFLIFSAFAFYTQPQTTLFIFMIAIPFGTVVLYFYAKKASGNDYKVEALASKCAEEIKFRIKVATSLDNSENEIIEISRKSTIIDRLDKLQSSLMGAETARFVMSVLTIVMLALVTLFSSFSANQVTTGELLIYLVALLMAFFQLSNLLTIASHFGRFYPTINRYKLLINWLNNAGKDSNLKRAVFNTSNKQVNNPDLDEF